MQKFLKKNRFEEPYFIPLILYYYLLLCIFLEDFWEKTATKMSSLTFYKLINSDFNEIKLI